MPVSVQLPDQMADTFYADGMPTLPAFMVYFGGLFAILRWWRQADPMRKTRLNLWATACCGLWAWVLSMFWQFPQPWGFMIAMTTAVSVQLAAPWMKTDERERLAQQFRQA